MKLLPLALVAVLLAVQPDVLGCGMAPRPGQYVEITNETALIIWDQESKTEHFIRRANFHSTSPDFGFLVPTPTQPQFAEVDDSVFDSLGAYTAPKIEYRTVKKPRPKPTRDDRMPNMAVGGATKSAAPRGVEVLDETEVGGQEAVVLKFHRGPKSDVNEDAKELAEWLKKRGYAFGPQLATWLKPYIENDWVMTAFRIAKRVAVGKGIDPATVGDATTEMQGKAVRMTFKTETPFYPYREPEATKMEPRPGWYPSSSRLLRVFFLASKRVDATLGTGNAAWVGTSPWSDKLNASQMEALAVKLKVDPAALKNVNWLTEFEDRSSPRAGTDEVYFKANDGPAFQRPVIIREVVEYYDDPNADASAGPDHADKPTPTWLMVVAVIGGVAFVSILGLLLVVILRQR